MPAPEVLRLSQSYDDVLKVEQAAHEIKITIYPEGMLPINVFMTPEEADEVANDLLKISCKARHVRDADS